MSTRTNLNHYRKLSNTIQLKSRYSTLEQPRLSQTFKLPALNAINKSVKYNDLSFATSRDLNKLRKQPEIADDYTEVAAHNILLNIRRKYDTINKTRQTKEHEIEELETEKEKYSIQKGKYVDQKSNAERRVKKLQQDLQNIKNLSEQGEMEKKVMTAMITRIKFDKIVYDQRKFNHQKEYTSITKTKNLIQRQNTINHEEQDKTRKVYIKLSEHFQAEQRQRNLHIANLQKMIQQKNQLVEYTTIRGAEMKEIAQNTLQDKDHKQKNWYKVYLCHRFVQKLLRDKMNREMIKFGTVELAFKNIKTETGTGEVQDLISKFLNKENIYGDLLGKIASDQKQISQLKTMNEDYTRQRNNLKSENAVLNSNKKDRKDLTHEEKQMLNISEKATVCELFYEKMKIWLHRNQKKFLRINNKHKQKFIESDDSIEIVSAFKEYLQQLNNSLSDVNEVPNNEDANLADTVKNKINVRIKVTEQNDDLRKNNETKEKDEEDFVHQLRDELHRDNEKFMKELKKKYEEIRKNRVQGEPKKKEASPQKPKHPEAI